MYVSQILAQYSSKLMQLEHDEHVMHHAKRALIDWYSSLIAGCRMLVTQSAKASVAENLDRGYSQLASGRVATVSSAALINATASHAAEVDDIYSPATYHPGAPTVSAALALAEELDRDAEELIKAIIVGYEVSTRIGRALGSNHYKYWHSTGTVGAFGAAAAAAAILRLDVERFAHALCIAATFSAGLQAAFKMEANLKPLHAGRAAEAGIQAALLAKNGITGALDIFEAELGFGHVMSKGVDWEKSLLDIQSAYLITKITFKRYACCGHIFAPIEGTRILQKKHNITIGSIKRIKIGTYQAALDIAGRRNPRTPEQARFSIPFVVATALVHGAVNLDSFSVERLKSQKIQELSEKIYMYIDTYSEQGFPDKRAAFIQIELNTGEKYSFYQPTRPGDPDYPLSDKNIEDKFMSLVSPVLGNKKAKQKLNFFWALDDKVNSREILKH